MLSIDRHISDLLYHNDCVVVPELGGFLASYSPSTIHPVQHTFSPPTKKIAFNVFLKQNDGLLASHISQSESFTYNQALKEIENYVDACLFRLSSGNKFVIEQVGILYKDVEGNLQFEPFKNINYLRDSFGLTAIQFLPIVLAKSEDARRNQARDFFALRPSERKAKYSKKKVINTVLTAGSALWLFFNLYIIAPSKFSFTSFNPAPRPTTVEKPIVKTSEKHEQVAAAAIISAPEISITPEPAKTITPEKPVEENYFVIGGAFRSDVNAEKFAETLKTEGFKDAYVIDEEAKLKLVCFDSFETLEEAKLERDQLKSQQKDAWVYHR